jgi:hypothetical protein
MEYSEHRMLGPTVGVQQETRERCKMGSSVICSHARFETEVNETSSCEILRHIDW